MPVICPGGGWENLPEGRQLEVVTALGDGEFSPRPRGEPLSQGLSFPHGASWSHPCNFLKIYYSFEIKSLKPINQEYCPRLNLFPFSGPGTFPVSSPPLSASFPEFQTEPAGSLITAFGKPGGQKCWPRPRPTGRRGHRSPWHVLKYGALPVLKGPKNQLRIKLPLFLIPRKPSVIKSGSGRMLGSLCSVSVLIWSRHGLEPTQSHMLQSGFPFPAGGEAALALCGPRTTAVSAAGSVAELRHPQGREMRPAGLPQDHGGPGFDLRFPPQCPYIHTARAP